MPQRGEPIARLDPLLHGVAHEGRADDVLDGVARVVQRVMQLVQQLDAPEPVLISGQLAEMVPQRVGENLKDVGAILQVGHVPALEQRHDHDRRNALAVALSGRRVAVRLGQGYQVEERGYAGQLEGRLLAEPAAAD